VAVSTLRKAAVFVASLPEPQAEGLLARLTPDEAAAVADEMAVLGEIAPGERDAVLREFAEADCPRFHSTGTRHLRLDRPHSMHDAADASPFQFLYDRDACELLSLLADEQPQTLALVFSYLPAQLAAETLAAMPPDRQTAVIGRIAAMGRPSEDVVRTLAEAVRRRVFGDVAPRTPHSMPIGVTNVVKMLNVMVPVAERRLLGDLAQADPDLHREIRRAMFGADVAACGEWNVTGAAC